MKISTFDLGQLALLAFTALAVSACGGGGRVLVVKSEPADAEICIKGRAKSEYFSNSKSCVGTTPFEADRVDVIGADGDKRTVKFKDVEGDKEKFYVVVTHAGYAAQAVEVPGWEHMITLKPVGTVSTPAVPNVAPAAPEAPAAKGSAKITSEPNGALVYINDALKGNTPFTYEGPSGVVRLKLELDGYQVLEKALTVEPGDTVKVNFKLTSNKAAAAEAAKAAPAQTEPVKTKEEAAPAKH